MPDGLLHSAILLLLLKLIHLCCIKVRYLHKSNTIMFINLPTIRRQISLSLLNILRPSSFIKSFIPQLACITNNVGHLKIWFDLTHFYWRFTNTITFKHNISFVDVIVSTSNISIHTLFNTTPQLLRKTSDMTIIHTHLSCILLVDMLRAANAMEKVSNFSVPGFWPSPSLQVWSTRCLTRWDIWRSRPGDRSRY